MSYESTASVGPVSLTHVVLEDLASGFRFRATTGKGHDVVFDSGKTATRADPVETLLSALGACHAMDVIGVLRKKRLDVTGYEVFLTGQRRFEHPRYFTAIETVHRVRGRGVPIAAVEEAVRLSEEKYCTVHHSLRRDIVFTTRIEVVDESSAPAPASDPSVRPA